MVYRFGKTFEDGDMILAYGVYTATDGIYISAWDEDGPYADVTICVPEISLEENEVILNHDILFDKDFMNSFLKCFAESKRPVSYNYANSYVVKLKENWKDFCIPMEW